MKKNNASLENGKGQPDPNIISPNLSQNKELIKRLFNDSSDLKYHEFETCFDVNAMLIYIEPIVVSEMLNRDVVGQLINSVVSITNPTVKDISDLIRLSDTECVNTYSDIEKKILNGKSILFVDGIVQAIVLPTETWQVRSISEPEGEITARGAHEGFVEDTRINKALLRKRIKNSNLIFEDSSLGLQTNTNVSLVYIKEIVNGDVLNELKRRLDTIDIDGVLDSGYIQELIRDHPLSPFNTVGYTERPDTVAGKLLEGRIAIICDGSPYVLTVPYLFLENLHVSEDYNAHFVMSSMQRILRLISFFLTLFTPGLYIALTSFHHEMIPEGLLVSFISSRSGVPLPTIVEVILMLVVFDIIRESGLRLPRAMGQTVSIVGALVLGQAAVEARFVSAPVIIIVAITAIASFIFFKLNGAIILFRTLIILLSAMFGIYGVIYASILLFLHLYSLRSFGILYMSYLGSFNKQEFKDTIVRAPWWYMHIRPKKITLTNSIRKGRISQ